MTSPPPPQIHQEPYPFHPKINRKGKPPHPNHRIPNLSHPQICRKEKPLVQSLNTLMIMSLTTPKPRLLRQPILILKLSQLSPTHVWKSIFITNESRISTMHQMVSFVVLPICTSLLSVRLFLDWSLEVMKSVPRRRVLPSPLLHPDEDPRLELSGHL